MNGRVALWALAVGAALSIGAGLIHFAFGPEHVTELGLLGYGFYLSGALQVGWAVVLGLVVALRRSERRASALRPVARAGIAINVVVLAAWAWSRIFGLPAGDTPWVPEAIGTPDAICGLLEAALVLGLVGWLRGWRVMLPVSSRPLAFAAPVLAIALIAAGTFVAIAPMESDAGAAQSGGGGMVMTMPGIEASQP
jgi:hypothetical protein